MRIPTETGEQTKQKIRKIPSQTHQMRVIQHRKKSPKKSSTADSKTKNTVGNQGNGS
jgi:hypothetical protein